MPRQKKTIESPHVEFKVGDLVTYTDRHAVDWAESHLKTHPAGDAEHLCRIDEFTEEGKPKVVLEPIDRCAVKTKSICLERFPKEWKHAPLDLIVRVAEGLKKPLIKDGEEIKPAKTQEEIERLLPELLPPHEKHVELTTRLPESSLEEEVAGLVAALGDHVRLVVAQGRQLDTREHQLDVLTNRLEAQANWLSAQAGRLDAQSDRLDAQRAMLNAIISALAGFDKTLAEKIAMEVEQVFNPLQEGHNQHAARLTAIECRNDPSLAKMVTTQLDGIHNNKH